MKRVERMLDLLHLRDGRFIHITELKYLSTKGFRDEDGLVAILKEGENEDYMYGKLHNDEIVSIDLKDPLNRKRAGISAYDPNNEMLSMLVDSWAAHKYGADAVNFEVKSD